MTCNLNASVKATYKVKTNKSSGKCAKFVREFLESGGFNTAGHPVFAKDYAQFLPKIGFKLIDKVSNESEYNPVPGDIAVYRKPGFPNQPGHICMFNGQHWVSDFVQNHMNVYRGPIAAFIYRYF